LFLTVARSVNVVVAGGGPAGLAFSYLLVKCVKRESPEMAKRMKVHVYDGRWKIGDDDNVVFKGPEDGNRRRPQVITLQDNVIDEFLTECNLDMFRILWPTIDERVWRSSRQIRIRDVEDRLLDQIQKDESVKNNINLIPRT
jgi:hypothetical protein